MRRLLLLLVFTITCSSLHAMNDDGAGTSLRIDDEYESARTPGDLGGLSEAALATAILRIVEQYPNVATALALHLKSAASNGYQFTPNGWPANIGPTATPIIGNAPIPALWKKWVIETVWLLSELAIKFSLVFFSGYLPAATTNIYNPLPEFTELPALVFFALEKFSDTAAHIIMPKKTAFRLAMPLIFLSVLIFAMIYGTYQLIKVDHPSPKKPGHDDIERDAFWELFFGDLPFLLSQYAVAGCVLTVYLVVHEFFEHHRDERRLLWANLYRSKPTH